MDASQTSWQDELARLLPDPVAALDEALEYVSCPICQVLAKLPYEYFRLLPGRWPQEPNLRAAVSAAGGFCNHHSWRLMSMQSNAAIARVFVDVLAGLAEEASTTEEACPVCRLECLAGEVLLGLLVERLGDEAQRERFGQLFGLCYPHWRALLREDLPAPIRDFLVESQRTRARELQQHLQGFLDKSAVELKWTRTLDESRAARRALQKTAGSEGV